MIHKSTRFCSAIFGPDFKVEKLSNTDHGPIHIFGLDSQRFSRNQKSSAGYTSKSHNEFERYLSSIANDYRAQDYQLFSRNCREYSQKLLNFLDPDNAREAKGRI